MKNKPVFQHDCKKCLFIKSLKPKKTRYDFYICLDTDKRALFSSVIARHGNDGHEYWSMPCSIILRNNKDKICNKSLIFKEAKKIASKYFTYHNGFEVVGANGPAGYMTFKKPTMCPVCCYELKNICWFSSNGYTKSFQCSNNKCNCEFAIQGEDK